MANMPGVGLEIFKADKEECKLFLALWAGEAHASRPWSGESLGFPR
ncbi:hypothetical protein T4A_1763 [Trichinella pseudospiralis]|uniref:Uncharacterized protein n=1 Tax=Trichinella pseudospiralis TaxID=6337 RepID=A0A0V1DNG9_TRIPS|nr:hypothetical protein T4A_1763 [Trichinella pseudospiralis]